MIVFTKSNAAKSFRQIKLLFGSAVLLASSGTIGHAGSIYPQSISTPPTQSADVSRACTGLEKAATLQAAECGTLTLSAVVMRMNALERDDQGD